ncbi:hypothetical protein Fmac_031990 [Flemingia macrophylla]|uniref:Uncharacterized protein n=1 Tax=Flemingia macrophylla TaxID=520843 RepID=A0ABD1L3L8_9FABA
MRAKGVAGHNLSTWCFSYLPMLAQIQLGWTWVCSWNDNSELVKVDQILFHAPELS